MRALIVGGGVGGLTAALALQRAGIDTVVREGHPRGVSASSGAFLMLMPNGLRALTSIGAYQAVANRSFYTSYIEHHDNHGQQLARTRIGGELAEQLRPRTLTRSSLCTALAEEYTRRGGTVHYGARLTSAKTNSGGGVTAEFSDHSDEHADLLIGADGVHSHARTMIDPTDSRALHTGYAIIYGCATAATTSANPETFHMVHGTDAQFGYVTSPDGSTYWFAQFPSTQLAEPDHNALRQWAASNLDCGPDASSLMRAEQQYVIAANTYEMPTADVWSNTSMVLLGDAAHAASPAAAQGASMAIEDALTLALCLRDIAGRKMAFARYTELRRARVERLTRFSANQARDASEMVREDENARDWLYQHTISWDATMQ